MMASDRHTAECPEILDFPLGLHLVAGDNQRIGGLSIKPGLHQSARLGCPRIFRRPERVDEQIEATGPDPGDAGQADPVPEISVEVIKLHKAGILRGSMADLYFSIIHTNYTFFTHWLWRGPNP